MLSARQQSILTELLEQRGFVPVDRFQSEYGISARTVRHDLLQIEDWLSGYGIGIERSRKHGIALILDGDGREKLERLLRERPDHLDAERRSRWLAKRLLESSKLRADQVQEELKISKSTLLSDLAEVTRLLGGKDLKLAREGGWIRVLGDERKKRSAYLELLRLEITDENVLRVVLGDREDRMGGTNLWNPWFSPKDAQFLFDIVRMLERKLNVEFTDAGYSALVLHLLMAVERLRNNHRIQMDPELFGEVSGAEEFRVVRQLALPEMERYFQLEVPLEEAGYITQHILGAQKAQDAKAEQSVYVQLAKRIVMEVEQELHRPLQRTEQVVHGLSVHLKPAMYRAKFGLQSANPLLPQLEQEYASLLDVTQEVVNRVLQEQGVCFDRDEIGYISLHLSSGLAHAVSAVRKRVAIVCSSGLGSSAILQRRLESTFPVLEIAGRFAYKELKQLPFGQIDAILSTIEIQLPLPVQVIKVSPLLSPEDESSIGRLLGVSPLGRPMEADTLQRVGEIVRIVERHADVRNRNRLLEDLIHLLQGGGVSGHKGLQRLSDLLPADSILTGQTVEGWEEAVRLGSRLLRERGIIGLQYEEKLLQMIGEQKHHFVIGEGIAFPHASPQDGVWGTGFSLVALADPVPLGPSGQPVWLLVTLAAADKTSHLTALSTLLDVFGDAAFMEFLRRADDAAPVWDRLKAKEGETLDAEN
ncbi:BglG family transcription antiterminator [Paenibacillus oleatilyticus]|uniref:BglG family transcription antiterminator n=1 Tax=Paenibacillus oleatilyticus TaxID=2594886 RepID=A0ABV4UUH0_9BACL